MCREKSRDRIKKPFGGESPPGGKEGTPAEFIEWCPPFLGRHDDCFFFFFFLEERIGVPIASPEISGL